MNIIGHKVSHAVFGKGVVADVSGKTVTVDFPLGKKKFVYPDAFSKFLILQDKNIQKEIVEDYNHNLAAKKAKIKCRRQLQKKICRLKSIKTSPQSQAVFNIAQDSVGDIIESKRIATGKYMSGASKGEPKIPVRLKPNSACVLTYIPEDKTEEDRIICGIFMVSDNFYGSECNDGFVSIHSKYNYIIPEENHLKYWDMVSEKGREKKDSKGNIKIVTPRWGSAAFKYFETNTMNVIIRKLISNTKDKDNSKTLKDFYKYFCMLNHIAEIEN